MDLKPCPCGETPENLAVLDEGYVKWFYAAPSCCETWCIEFFSDYKAARSEACYALAVEAWNAAPRRED